MELLKFFAATVAAWAIKKGLDAMWEAWKRRRAVPLNNAQVLAAHRRDFAMALLAIVWCCVMSAWAGVVLSSYGSVPTALALAGFIALGVWAARSARRRLRRVREAKATLERFG